MDNQGFKADDSDDKKDGSVEMRRRAGKGEDQQNGFVENPEVEVENVRMKKTVGLFSGISLIVGTIIGSGIFISPKGVLEETGSVGLSLTVWAGAGILALFGSLCYAELGTLIRKSGGEYAYLQEAFGNIPAFLLAWTSIIVIRTSSIAIITLTFAEYMVTFFPYCGSPNIPLKLVAALAIVSIAALNCIDARLASNVQILTTVAKLIALLIISIGGIVRMAQGHVTVLNTGFKGTTDKPSTIALAFYDALWSYDGWNNLNYVTEEIQDPKKNLPRANIIGVLLVTVVYIFTNMSYLTAMTSAELLVSDAVAVSSANTIPITISANIGGFSYEPVTVRSSVEQNEENYKCNFPKPTTSENRPNTWGDRVLGTAGIIMPIAVLFSTYGAANGTIFSGGRLVYCAGRDGNMPEMLSHVHCTRYTPVPSLIFTTIISIIMVIPGNVQSLVDFFSFTAWIFYGSTVFSLIVMRFTKKDAERPIKVPIVIPILFVLVAIYLVIGPLINKPQIEFLYAFLFIIGGLIFYFPLIHFKLQMKWFDKLTTYSQMLFEVVPSPYEPDT